MTVVGKTFRGIDPAQHGDLSAVGLDYLQGRDRGDGKAGCGCRAGGTDPHLKTGFTRIAGATAQLKGRTERLAPEIVAVTTSRDFPAATAVTIIGGGIVGLTAALTLAERGVRVVVLEKGKIAGEQSSRNLGWIRKTNRSPLDVPLSLAADRLWREMPQRVGTDVVDSQAGIMFLARGQDDLAAQEGWLQSAQGLDLDSRASSARSRSKSSRLAASGVGLADFIRRQMVGAEPTLASSAIAIAAMRARRSGSWKTAQCARSHSPPVGSPALSRN